MQVRQVPQGPQGSWASLGQGTLERIRFGEFLLERQALDDGQLLDVLAEHWAHGGRLGATVVRRGFLSLDQVEELAAEYHALSVVEVGAE